MATNSSPSNMDPNPPEMTSLTADEIRAKLKAAMRDGVDENRSLFTVEPDKPLAELQADLIRQREEQKGRRKQHAESQAKPPRHGYVWRDDEFAMVITALKNDMSIARISELIGRSTVSIRAKLMQELTDAENDLLLDFIAAIFKDRS